MSLAIKTQRIVSNKIDAKIVIISETEKWSVIKFIIFGKNNLYRNKTN